MNYLDTPFRAKIFLNTIIDRELYVQNIFIHYEDATENADVYQYMQRRGIVTLTELPDNDGMVLDPDWKEAMKWQKVWSTPQLLTAGDLMLDVNTGVVSYKTVKAELSIESNSYKLLKYLLENKNKMMSYSEIHEHVFSGQLVRKGDKDYISDNVKVIKRLLRTDKQDGLFVSRGGYMIVDE